MSFDFKEFKRKAEAAARAAQRAKLGPPKKTMFGDPPPPESPWVGSVVNERIKPLPKVDVAIMGNEDEITYAWRIYDATLAISLGNRELADEAFQKARIHFRKEKHAVQAAVHEGRTAGDVGEGAQQVDEPVDEGRDIPSGDGGGERE